MTPSDRTRRLREIKQDNDLTAGRIARSLNRTTDTVYHWLSGEHYQIPEHALRLLELEVQRGKA